MPQPAATAGEFPAVVNRNTIDRAYTREVGRRLAAAGDGARPSEHSEAARAALVASFEQARAGEPVPTYLLELGRETSDDLGGEP